MFLTTFRRFPKIFQDCSEGLTNVSEHFSNIFWRLPKISEEVPMMLRSYNTTSEYFLSDYVAIAMVLFSRVKISCYLHGWRYHVYALKLTYLKDSNEKTSTKGLITWRVSARAELSARLAGLKFCCDYMKNFSPGWNVSLDAKYEIVCEKSQENQNAWRHESSK